jgi:acyl-CoA reductase-like NAD-dependent aldehyde dehydrogenase
MYDNLLAGVPTDLWIGGGWRKSSDGARFDVFDPATENLVASVASATVEDAAAALDAAQDAFGPWAARKPRERAEILRKAHELVMRDAERLAKLITLENGKALPDSRSEVAYAAEFFRWYAEEAVRNIGEVSIAPSSGARILVHHRPAGVALLVTPWNYPAAMATRKIAPALAAGCPVVLKPASDTPLTMLALMPIMEEAGVPPGVINVIPSRSSGAVVSSMLHDMRVRVVSFTGSTDVGRKLLLVDDAVSKGAKVLTGGRLPEGPGFFYPATVLIDVPDGAKMLDEEIFGPVASIQRFSSDDDAIRRANDTEYGLVAYLFTRDMARGLRMSERLDFGMIGLNRGLVSDPAAAFGGMKQSGLGREGAHEGMMEFLESQYVSVVW